MIGDMNQDKKIDAVDAAIILKAVADAGAGKQSGLSPEAEQNADVNQDNKTDAEDAAIILIYAAKQGSGEVSVDFETYLKMK